MKINNKRGVSGVVTAVLLILLVIAAIGILWVVVQNFVQQGTTGVSGSANCLSTTFDIESATTSGVSIKRTGGSADVDALRVVSDGTLVTTHTPTGSFTIGEIESISAALTSGNSVEVSAVFGDTVCSPGASTTVQ